MSSSDREPSTATLSRRRFLRSCLLGSAGLALVAACGPQAPAGPKPGEAAKQAEAKPAAAGATPTKGGTLRVGFYLDAATMDPPSVGEQGRPPGLSQRLRSAGRDRQQASGQAEPGRVLADA